MAQVTVDIPDEELSRLKPVLEKNGGDLAQYVSEKFRRGLFWDTLDLVNEQNRDLTEEEADALANEAVDWARATRS